MIRLLEDTTDVKAKGYNLAVEKGEVGRVVVEIKPNGESRS